MALTKCRECGADISSSAFVCPKCGHPAGQRRWLKSLIIVQIAIVIAILALIYGLIAWLT